MHSLEHNKTSKSSPFAFVKIDSLFQISSNLLFNCAGCKTETIFPSRVSHPFYISRPGFNICMCECVIAASLCSFKLRI